MLPETNSGLTARVDELVAQNKALLVRHPCRYARAVGEQLVVAAEIDRHTRQKGVALGYCPAKVFWTLIMASKDSN
jgi:hypothetical protein